LSKGKKLEPPLQEGICEVFSIIDVPKPFKEHSNNVLVKEKTSELSKGCSKLPSCVKASLVGWK